jgi:hypothetical protein
VAYDNDFSSVTLLLHCDGTNGSTTFTDVKGHAVTANGNAQVSTAQSQWGGASGLFDGTGDYLITGSSSDFDLGVGDFTIESWVFTASSTGLQNIISRQCADSNGSGYALQVRLNSGKPEVVLRGGSTTVYTLSATNPLTTNTWYHLAVCRAAGVANLFVSGVSVATGSAPADLIGTDALTIGTLYVTGGAPSSYFNGNIDDIRITKGIARYSANFTPPTEAFPDIGPPFNGYYVAPSVVSPGQPGRQGAPIVSGHVPAHQLNL